MNPCRLSLAVLLPILCWACSSSSFDDAQVGSIYVSVVDVIASDGAVIEVGEADSLLLAGTVLVIPPNSLARDTRITLAEQRSPIVLSPQQPVGPVAVWGPTGTMFQLGAQLTLPYLLTNTADVSALYMQVLEGSGTRLRVTGLDVAVDAASSSLTAEIAGFTRFQSGVLTCEVTSSGSECPTGLSCQGNRCQALGIEDCTDAVDNDDDVLVDCDDPDCFNNPICIQADPETLCDDQTDNDGDLLVDCADPDCASNGLCLQTDVETLCDDQVDNDGDQVIDCADPDCYDDILCDPSQCFGTDCINEDCSNGVDDDGDRLADCDDPDCIDSGICDAQCCLIYGSGVSECVASCPVDDIQSCTCSSTYCAIRGGPC